MLRPARCTALAACLLLVPGAGRALDLELVSLLALQEARGWILHVEVEGTSDIVSVSLVPPGRAALAIPCTSGGGISDCTREVPASGLPGFATLAALLAAYPAGTWTLVVNGGPSAALGFSPVAPDAGLVVTAPADGAVDVSPTPSVDYALACTNCNFLYFQIRDQSPSFDLALESSILAAPPLPATGSMPYAMFEAIDGATPAALPDARYELEIWSGVGMDSTGSLGGDPFEYGRGAATVWQSVFTVPEPAAAASGAAALAAAAALRARRRRPR
jgi:hypothetical protein